MLIQQGLSELKLIKKRMEKILEELETYSAWCSKKKKTPGQSSWRLALRYGLVEGEMAPAIPPATSIEQMFHSVKAGKTVCRVCAKSHLGTQSSSMSP